MSLDHRVHVVHCDCEGVPVNDWGSHGRSRDAQLHTAQRKRSLREELHRALDADLSLLIVIERAEVSKVLLSLRLRHRRRLHQSSRGRGRPRRRSHRALRSLTRGRGDERIRVLELSRDELQTLSEFRERAQLSRTFGRRLPDLAQTRVRQPARS